MGVEAMPLEGGSADSGQAAVEAALTLPLTVFVTLGIVQLALAQQARLFTEYAAFQASRAGVVWNGHLERMHDAAMVALLPTLGRTDELASLGRVWQEVRSQDPQFSALPWSDGGRRQFRGLDLQGRIRVDPISPAGFPELGAVRKLRGGADWVELDPDDLDGDPEPTPRGRPAGISSDREEAILRQATVLSVRVRYWYELRVPFANWAVFLAWYASNAGAVLRGPVDRPQGAEGLGARAVGVALEKGLPQVTPAEMRTAWGLATGELSVGSEQRRRFFLPLEATYSMRMQSSFHRKWLLHEKPDWGP